MERENQNQLTASQDTEPTVVKAEVQEDNKPKEEKTIVPMVQPTPPLTIEEVGADELYKAYLEKKPVKWPSWLIEKDGKIEVSRQDLFIYISETEHILSVKQGNSKGITLYHYKNGRYEPWAEIDRKSYIKSFIPRKIRSSSDWEGVDRELTTEYANTEESELNADENIINFKNGILDLTTGNLLPHDPKYLSTIQIPCNYIQNLPLAKAPVTMKFLQDITGGNADDMATILEIIGLAISNVPGWKYKKLVILHGPGDTGKSVLREFVIDLLGKENCFTVDMNQLHSKFGASGIVGKRLVRKWRLKVC